MFQAIIESFYRRQEIQTVMKFPILKSFEKQFLDIFNGGVAGIGHQTGIVEGVLAQGPDTFPLQSNLGQTFVQADIPG
jgi:hypothetical protein